MLSHFSLVWLCSSMDCSPSVSFVHEICQGGILEWVAMPSSRGSSQPRDQNCFFCGFCIADKFFTAEPLGKPNLCHTFNQLARSLVSSAAVSSTRFFFLSKIIYRSVSLNCNSVLAFCFSSHVCFLMITLYSVLRLVMWLHDLDHDMSLLESRKIP